MRRIETRSDRGSPGIKKSLSALFGALVFDLFLLNNQLHQNDKRRVNVCEEPPEEHYLGVNKKMNALRQQVAGV
jgi:hypothetical protein